MRVYVAGKYSDNNVMSIFDNMRRGIRAATAVFVQGMSPFCPWLDYHYCLQTLESTKLTVEQFYKYSMDWLEVSDVMYVLDGYETSKGTLAEIERAKELNIPIVYNFYDLMKFKTEFEAR